MPKKELPTGSKLTYPQGTMILPVGPAHYRIATLDQLVSKDTADQVVRIWNAYDEWAMENKHEPFPTSKYEGFARVFLTVKVKYITDLEKWIVQTGARDRNNSFYWRKIEKIGTKLGRLAAVLTDEDTRIALTTALELRKRAVSDLRLFEDLLADLIQGSEQIVALANPRAGRRGQNQTAKDGASVTPLYAVNKILGRWWNKDMLGRWNPAYHTEKQKGGYALNATGVLFLAVSQALDPSFAASNCLTVVNEARRTLEGKRKRKEAARQGRKRTNAKRRKPIHQRANIKIMPI